MSAKLKLIVPPPDLERSFRGVAFEVNNTATNFTAGECESLLRLIRSFNRAGLLTLPNFIYASDKSCAQEFGGILAPRSQDGKNAFYVFKKSDPKAASEYTLVMRGFVETGKMSERVETINFPVIMKELGSFFSAHIPQASHLTLVHNS